MPRPGTDFTSGSKYASPADAIRSRGMAPGTRMRTDCPLCGGTSLKLILRLRDRNLMQCGECGVKSTDKIGEPDAIADYYTEVQAHQGKADVDAVEEGPGPLAAIARGQADWIEELCGPRRFGSFLEVGCSRGHLLEEMETRGWDVSGIDVSRSSTREAQDRCKNAVVYCGEPGDAEAPFEPESFDRIAMYDVLAHLAEPVDTLKQVAAYLKPGGRLVLSSCNESWALVPWMLRAFALFPGRTADLRDEMYEGQHYCYFSTENIGRLLETVGLRLVRQRPLRPLSTKYFIHQYSPRRRLALLTMVQIDRLVGSSRKMLVLAEKPKR